MVDTTSSDTFDLESLIHLEQSFYDAGYADGRAHGRIHGLIDGRAVGREKGYALWEEIGFYAGVARVWAAFEADKQSRIESHARHLLELIDQFPRTNPSQPGSDTVQVDIAMLLSKIRARYRALCATLGIRPRLRPADDGVATDAQEDAPATSKAASSKSLWRIEKKDRGSNDMSF